VRVAPKLAGEGRRVVVTGAGGYVGHQAVDQLLALGCEVHTLAREDSNIAGVHVHRADLLTDGDLTWQLAAIGADTLLHCAWSVAPGRFWTDPANIDWVAASLRLFRAFVSSGGRRIVGVGSCAEYDWTGSPFVEKGSPIRPSTLYGNAKAALGGLLTSFARQESISAGWGRLFFLYGPREPRGKLVADAICTLIAGQRLATTPGLQRRDFMHVEDAGRALALLALSGVEGPVNIASGVCVPVRRLIERIEILTRTSELVDYGARAPAPGDPPELAANIVRARDELGFVPRFNIDDGLADTVDWWIKKLGVRTDAERA